MDSNNSTGSESGDDDDDDDGGGGGGDDKGRRDSCDDGDGGDGDGGAGNRSPNIAPISHLGLPLAFATARVASISLSKDPAFGIGWSSSA